MSCQNVDACVLRPSVYVDVCLSVYMCVVLSQSEGLHTSAVYACVHAAMYCLIIGLMLKKKGMLRLLQFMMVNLTAQLLVS